MADERTHSLDDTLALMRDLRARCEWDAAQTHDSLRPYLIEEAHELDDAIRLEDDKLIREELGDLLFQVLFHSVMAEERGVFSFSDVAEGLITKLKRSWPKSARSSSRHLRPSPAQRRFLTTGITRWRRSWATSSSRW